MWYVGFAVLCASVFALVTTVIEDITSADLSPFWTSMLRCVVYVNGVMAILVRLSDPPSDNNNQFDDW